MKKSAPVIYFDSIDSTNKYALRNIENLQDRTLIVAGQQTNGKGRNNKDWHSPKTNLYVSYLIKPKKQILLQTSWIGGLAVLKSLKSVSGLNDLWIKWPNDIFFNNKKICGVLCESKSFLSEDKTSSGIVIGMGINVNCTNIDLINIPKPCTSIFIETGKTSNIQELYKLLHENLNNYYTDIIDSGIETLYKEWKTENKLIGKNIILETSSSDVQELKVLDINQDGAIIGIDKDCNINTIYSGDVSVKKF